MDVDTAVFVFAATIVLASALAAILTRRTFHSVMFLGVALVAIAGLYMALGSGLIGVIQILVYVGGILTLFVFAVMFVAGDETEEEAPKAVHVSGYRFWRLVGAITLGLEGFSLMAGALVLVHRGLASLVRRLLGGWLEDLVLFGILLVILVAGSIALWLGWRAGRRIYQSWPGARILGLVNGLVFMALVAMALGATAWPDAATDASIAEANDITTVVDALFDEQLLPFEILGILLTAVMFGALVIARPIQSKPGEETIHVHPNVATEAAAAPTDVATPEAPAATTTEAQP